MTDRAALQAQLEQGIAALGLSLPAEAVPRLLDYLALLERWNAAYNLTAIRDPAEMVTRHLLDSLAILPYVQGDTLADLGTGPGLPGIPLAIAAPGRQIVLVDSNGKKVRFLRRIPVDPMTGKAEWGLHAMEDDPTSDSYGGQSVFDVHSKSTGIALDGTKYADW